MNASTAPTTKVSLEQRRLRRLASFQPYLYVLPAVLFVAAFLLYPMVYTLWQGFTDSNGLTAPNFVGFANYSQLFGNANFLLSLKNTLIWVVASVALSSLADAGEFTVPPAVLTAAVVAFMWIGNF